MLSSRRCGYRKRIGEETQRNRFKGHTKDLEVRFGCSKISKKSAEHWFTGER